MRRFAVALLLLSLCVAPAGAQLTLSGVGGAFGGASAGGLPLDGISGVVGAYSTRKLKSAYAGFALQVTRSSDSTTQNIGFVANVLDTTTLASFCSGTTCLVNIWYDQGGNGNDGTSNCSFTGCPTIYTSGAVVTLNGRPAMTGPSGGSCYFATTVSANPTNTLYQNIVASDPLTNSESDTIDPDAGSALLYRWKSSGSLYLTVNGIVDIANSTGTFSANTGSILESSYNSSSGAYAFWINRSASGFGTQTETLSAAHAQICGQPFGASGLVGTFGEIIRIDAVGGISGPNQTALTGNQHTYWGTP